MGVARRFIKYNSVDGSLKIKEGMTSEDDLGEYTIRITLKTESGLESMSSFILRVVEPVSLISVPAEGEEEVDTHGQKKKNQGLVDDEEDADGIPKPHLELIDNVGEA